MIPIGVCIFDDNQSPTGGWASISGAQAVRIRGIMDLRNDVFWVLSLDYKIVRKLGIYNAKNMSDAQFFRASVNHLMEESGIRDKREQAVAASEMLSRVTAYSEQLFDIGVNGGGYRFYTTLADKIVPSSAKKKVDGPVDLMDVKEGLVQSYQSLQKMTGKTPKGSSAKNFVYPRGSYYSWILGLDYPGGEDWKELSKKSYGAIFGFDSGHVISGTKTVIDRLTELGKKNAAIFRVTVHSQVSDTVDYQQFGNGADVIRRWATLPEILHLSRFSKLEISGGYSTPLSPLSISSQIKDSSNEFSISRGLLLENIFVALASPIYAAKSRHTALAAYMRAYDRIACARAAEYLVDSGGYVIGSFGLGRVTVFLRETEMDGASNIALQCGLMPPAINTRVSE